MSWNWNNDEEEKVYELKGTVTIGCDEYRDLIRRVEQLKIAGQKEHDDWYKVYSEKGALEKKYEELKKKYEEMQKFFSDNELNESFKLWKFEKQAEIDAMAYSE